MLPQWRFRVATRVAVSLAACLLAPAGAAASPCASLPGWFSGVPDLPSFTPTGSCQFEQWSWQAMLALLTTGPSQPVARYFTWDLPHPDMTNLFCENVCKMTGTAPKNPCHGPDAQEVVNATTQPGFSPPGGSGRLVDQAGQFVYFTAHVSPGWVSFVTSQHLYDPAVLGAAAPQTAFPAGIFEIKASWRLAAGMSQAERAHYYLTQACVVPEPNQGGPITEPTVTEVALVGFHVTGGVSGHPELVWATFEQQDNAPDCDMTPIVGRWSLYDGRADCSSHPELCNQPSADASTPTNVCRVNPFGGANVEVARQIASLNRDVHARLPRSSPLHFYNLVGTVWAADPRPAGYPEVPTFNLQDPAGSPLLANTTLETYKQNLSCFGCHNAQFPGEFAALTEFPPGTPPPNPVVAMDKSLFVSHVLLFPFFMDPSVAGCKAICSPSSGAATMLRPGGPHAPQ